MPSPSHPPRPRAPAPYARPVPLRSAAAVAAAVAVVVLLFFATLGWPVGERTTPGSCATAWEVAPRTSTPIRHLFVIVKENHAFENYFGALPGVLGNPPNGTFPLAFGSNATVQPFPLTGYSTPDLPHDAASALVDYNGGANNLFVAQASAMGAASPQDAVGYYTAAQVPAYYAYAHDYALGDRFFSGVLGPTYPNRVFDLSAYVGSWNSDTLPPANVTDHPTILDQLTHAGISWYYDYAGYPFFLAPSLFPSLTSNPCSSGRITDAAGLANQLAAPVPPSVAFLDPSNSLTVSEHPPENVTVGEEWTVAAVNTVFTSPVANSSAVLIFFDESGGFWDPVPPPLTSTGRDGFRIPFLVLSPWTPAGTVCSTTLDPAAVLEFIDTNWGLPALTSRVASAGNLSCFFNFSAPARAPILLSTGGSPSGAPTAVGAAAPTPDRSGR